MSYQDTSGAAGVRPASEAERLAKLEPLVRREVNAARRRYPWAAADDLHQWGAIGLLKALRSSTRDPDLPLEPFAVKAIRNEIHNCPEIRRGVDRALLARVSQAHDSLMAADVRRPTPDRIVAESKRLDAQRSARSGRPAHPALTPEQVEQALQMLAVASPESIDARMELGWEPSFVERGPGARIPPGWFDAFAKVVDRMIDDCGLGREKSFVLRHLVFGATMAGGEPTTAAASAALSTSEGNIRVLKLRARRAVEDRVAACLEQVGVAEKAQLLTCMILLAAYQDEVAMATSARAEEALVDLRAALERGVKESRSPEWLLHLVELLLVFVRKVGAP